MCRPTDYNPCTGDRSFIQNVLQDQNLYLLYLFFGVTVLAGLIMIILIILNNRKLTAIVNPDQERQTLMHAGEFSKTNVKVSNI